ncbi:MAG: ABC transporter permease [Actinobacteria bacterium]|nr:ABC transporter permease [Actinomycetota bacterium]
MNDLLERWRDLDKRLRVALGIVVTAAVYLIALKVPGIGPWLHKKMPFGIVIIGLITGAVTALLAIGLILIYRTNRFINFAYGSMGSFVGVLSVGMYLQHHWSYWVILPVGVITGAVVGALVEFLVIRRFANSSRLIVTVASIGLAQLLGGLELLGSKGIGFTSLTGAFPIPIHFNWHIDVATLGGDQIIIVAAVPVIIAGLAWFLLKTHSGIAVRGAAENAERALLYGIPVRRLSTIVWMIAGALATLTYLLKAPFSGVAPGAVANGPTVLLPGLAAAVVARMESLPTAFAAGLGLGVMEQVVRWNSQGTPSFQNVVFFIVIIGALLVQRGALSRAKTGITSSWSATGVVKPIPRELKRLPEVRWAKLALVTVVAALFVLLPWGWSDSGQLLAAFAIVWAIVGVSLVILTGWGGHISLGQFGIVGVGAVVGGNLVAKAHADMFLALLAAGAAGALIALIVGLPALRIQGLFLAVTTLAFAIALNAYFFNPDNAFSLGPIHAKFSDLLPSDVRRPFLWHRFDMESNYIAYLVCLAFLALAILASVGVRKARSGRVVVATRDNQKAADAAAVPTTSVKLSAFLLAGVIAGIAGGLQVILLHKLGQNTFNPVDSLTVFSTAVIGGLGSVPGAISGVLIFRYLETITALGDLRQAITGAGLLLVLLVIPGGFGQVMLNVRDRYLRWVARRRDVLVPSLVADRRVEEEGDHAPAETDLLESALSDEAVEATEAAEADPVGAGR